MRKPSYLIIAILAFTFACLSCSDNGDKLTSPGSGQSYSTARFHLTDAPASYDSVLVTFSEVAVLSDSGWITVSSETQTYDLLSLTGGVTTLLGETKLQAGTYGQIRLKIVSAVVVKDGTQYSLSVPSGAQSGLKIGSGFTVQEGQDIDLVLDFDAARSVVSAGASGQFILRPTIRLVENSDNAMIEGKLVIPSDSISSGLTVFVIAAGGDTVSSSIVRFESESSGQMNGQFKLSFLPQGTYNVVVIDSSGAVVYSYGSVNVSASGNVDLGTQLLLGAVISSRAVYDENRMFAAILSYSFADKWLHS